MIAKYGKMQSNTRLKAFNRTAGKSGSTSFRRDFAGRSPAPSFISGPSTYSAEVTAWLGYGANVGWGAIMGERKSPLWGVYIVQKKATRSTKMPSDTTFRGRQVPQSSPPAKTHDARRNAPRRPPWVKG
jgi:hypothetical protein